MEARRPGRCYLLEGLPPELRLRIYEYAYGEPVLCRLYIRKGQTIEQPVGGKGIGGARPALHLSCKTIYKEATPVLYAMTEFTFNIFSVRTSYPFNDISLIHECPFLHRLQRLEIHICLYHTTGAVERLQKMEALAVSIETAGARIKALRVSNQACAECRGRHDSVRSKGFVEQCLQGEIDRLTGKKEGELQSGLYRKMLHECTIGDEANAA